MTPGELKARLMKELDNPTIVDREIWRFWMDVLYTEYCTGDSDIDLEGSPAEEIMAKYVQWKLEGGGT